MSCRDFVNYSCRQAVAFHRPQLQIDAASSSFSQPNLLGARLDPVGDLMLVIDNYRTISKEIEAKCQFAVDHCAYL